MNEFEIDRLSLNTLSVHGGHNKSIAHGNNEPIFPTSSYVFDNAYEAAERFASRKPGNIYSRFTNPTVRAFENQLALLEGGERCIATASGSAAVFTITIGLLKKGDHIVCSQSVSYEIQAIFNDLFSKLGVITTFVDLTDFSAWETAIREDTQFLYVETPSSPLSKIVDIKTLANLAHDYNSLLIVDNTFCTPILQRPLDLGADIIVHSDISYLDGQNRCEGGAIIGKKDLMETNILPFLKTGGPSLSPFNAWVFLGGLQTLPIRMSVQCSNAKKLAYWLSELPAIHSVYYLGIESHPQHDLAMRQQKGLGAVLSFELAIEKLDAWKLIDAMTIFSISTKTGNVKSTIYHPATTTHSQFTVQERKDFGITEGLIRISIGLEDIDDLKNDIQNALNTL